MHHDTGSLRLIRDKSAQLKERPTVVASSLSLLPGLLVGPLPNACQIFQGDSTCRVEGRGNEVLANLMVGLTLKAGFTPRQPCQKLTSTSPCTSGAFRGFPLKCCTQAGYTDHGW